MKTTTAKHIVTYLEDSQEAMAIFLKKLVATETPSNDPKSQMRIMNLLKEVLEELDFYVWIEKGKTTGGYLYARPLYRIKHKPIQLMVGHCDTVWRKNTLEEMPIVEAENKISGPGVFDMKAGLIQIIYAIKTIRDLDLSCGVTPVIIINSDEEIGSLESTRIITRLSRIAVRAYVLEPPLGFDGHLKTARKGIGRFIVTVKGKPAHAGLNPDKGVSAIVELSYQIQHLFALNDFEKGITVNVGMIEGGSSANVIAAESRAVIDVRVKNQEDADYISSKIFGLKPIHKDSGLKIEGYFGRPPMERTKRNQDLWELAKGLGKSISIDLKQATAGGGSDGNTTSLFTATLDGLGTVGDGAHAKHEFIFKDKLIERTALLTILLLAKPIKNNI
jgi:glutamate carboxypeptidase